MKTIYSLICLFAFVSVGSTPSFSAQFRDSDVLPEIRYLLFSQEAVGFVSQKNEFYGHYATKKPTRSEASSKGGSDDVIFYFVFDRGNRNIVEVDAGQFRKRFPANPPKDDPIRDPSQQYDLIGRTTGGAEYKLKMKYCGEGVTDEIRKVVVNNKTVSVRSRAECSSVSAIEIVSDQLWLGTAYSGEGGLSEAEGVVVQKLNGRAVLARLATEGAVIHVKADPFSNNVWVVTDAGIFEISPQFKILRANLYNHDVEPSTGEPRFAFSANIASGNPLWVLSRLLPRADRKSFYETVTKIPRGDLKTFDLYNFFMGCGPAYDESAESAPKEWPKTLRPLFPFFVKANPQCANGALTNSAIRFQNHERYRCRYGLNRAFRAELAAGPLHAVAEDESGEVREVELDGHPFFVATLFQPERAALTCKSAPIVAAFAAACAA